MNPEEVVAYLQEKQEFKWESVIYEGLVLDKDGLIRAITEGSENGKRFLVLVEHCGIGLDGIGEAVESAFNNDASNELGKRYKCPKCNSEALATKKGSGRVFCCGGPMILQVPRPLPSSD